MYLRKKIFLFLFMLVSSRTLFAQILSANEIRQIKDLYSQEDFEVLKQIILFKGFTLTKNIQAYTADYANYKNVFTFSRNSIVFKSNSTSTQIEDKLSFETIDYGFYKAIHFDFKLSCEQCDTQFLGDMTWHYKNIENMKVSKDYKSEYRHEVEYNGSDTIWAEDLTEPGILWKKNFWNIIVMQHDLIDLRDLFYPFYQTFSGKYYLNVPYSPIDCSPEEYSKRQELKQKFIVPITQSNGSYYVLVNVGGVLIKYLIDSGASIITIDSKTEANLLKNGIITKQNYLAPSSFQLADGSSKQFRRVTIPWMVIKGIQVDNVIAAIIDENSSSLLGKSFFDKFSYWKIDNIKNTLELQKK